MKPTEDVSHKEEEGQKEERKVHCGGGVKSQSEVEELCVKKTKSLTRSSPVTTGTTSVPKNSNKLFPFNYTRVPASNSNSISDTSTRFFLLLVTLVALFSFTRAMATPTSLTRLPAEMLEAVADQLMTGSEGAAFAIALRLPLAWSLEMSRCTRRRAFHGSNEQRHKALVDSYKTLLENYVLLSPARFLAVLRGLIEIEHHAHVSYPVLIFSLQIMGSKLAPISLPLLTRLFIAFKKLVWSRFLLLHNVGNKGWYRSFDFEQEVITAVVLLGDTQLIDSVWQMLVSQMDNDGKRQKYIGPGAFVAAIDNGLPHSMIQFLLSRTNDNGMPYTCDEVLNAATLRNDLDLMKMLVDNKCRFHIDSVALPAAEQGHLHILQWLAEYRDTARIFPPIPYDTILEEAAWHGHLHIMQWAHGRFKKEFFNIRAWVGAALGGHFHIIDWLRANEYPRAYKTESENNHDDDDIVENEEEEKIMIATWHIEKIATICPATFDDHLIWALDNGFDFEDEIEALRTIATMGHRRLLEYFLPEASDGTNLGVHRLTAVEAGCAGHMDIVRWCVEEFEVQNLTEIKDGVMSYGDLSIVQWLHARGSKPFTSMGLFASGHVHILEWLLNNGKIWESFDSRRLEHAAKEGHLHMIQWAVRTQKAVLLPEVLEAAAKNGFLHVIQWCVANGCEWSDKVIPNAAKQGHPETLKWLHLNGCPWGEGVKMGSDYRFVDEKMMKWALMHGCPCDDLSETCMRIAKTLKDAEILEWAMQQGVRWRATNIQERLERHWDKSKLKAWVEANTSRLDQ